MLTGVPTNLADFANCFCIAIVEFWEMHAPEFSFGAVNTVIFVLYLPNSAATGRYFLTVGVPLSERVEDAALFCTEGATMLMLVAELSSWT
jgi:hypothetical protein